MNSNGKSPKPEEVKEENEETDGGFQSDEVDLSRTKVSRRIANAIFAIKY